MKLLDEVFINLKVLGVVLTPIFIILGFIPIVLNAITFGYLGYTIGLMLFGGEAGVFLTTVIGYIVTFGTLYLGGM